MADSQNPRHWLEFAETDLNTAEHLLNTMRPEPYEIICYHCQQAAEKYLKGFLIAQHKDPPHIHDLDELCKLCQEIKADFSNIADICSELTGYGVQSKYPVEISLEKADALRAIQDAKSLKNFLRAHAAELF